MSTALLSIIPVDPTQIPSVDATHNAMDYLQHEIPDAREFEIRQTDMLQFVHPGEWFEAIYCPECATDITKWGGDQLDALSYQAATYEQLTVNTPCCNQPTSLNDLRYHTDAGFTRFAIVIYDAGICYDLLPDAHMIQLEVLLDCRLKQIRTHV